MHLALLLDLQHLAVAWLLISVVAVLVWAVDAIRGDLAELGGVPAGRWQRITPEPPRLTLIDGTRRCVYDQDHEVA